MKKLFTILTIMVCGYGVLASGVAVVRADLAQDVKQQSNAFAGQEGAGILSKKDPRTIVAQAIKVLLSFVGTIILLYTFYAGYLWMTAGGETEKIDTAKHILKNCTIGTILALSSYSIVVLLGRYSGIQQNGTGINIETENNRFYINTEQAEYTGCDQFVEQWDETQKKFVKVPNPAFNDPLNPMCQSGGVKTGPL